MTTALVVQHIRCEPPGVFTGVLERHGITIENKSRSVFSHGKKVS